MKRTLDRRRFVLAAVAVAGAGAAGAGIAPISEACAAAHAKFVAKLERGGRGARMVVESLATIGRDIVCPYCGEPFIKT